MTCWAYEGSLPPVCRWSQGSSGRRINAESTPIAAANLSLVAAPAGGVTAAIDNFSLRATDVLHARHSRSPSQSRTLLAVSIQSSVLRAKNSLSKSLGPYLALKLLAHWANTPWFSFPISMAARYPMVSTSQWWNMPSVWALKVKQRHSSSHYLHSTFWYRIWRVWRHCRQQWGIPQLQGWSRSFASKQVKVYTWYSKLDLLMHSLGSTTPCLDAYVKSSSGSEYHLSVVIVILST